MGRGDEDQGAVPKIVANLLNVQSCNHSFLLFSDNPMDLLLVQFHNPCYGFKGKTCAKYFQDYTPNRPGLHGDAKDRFAPNTWEGSLGSESRERKKSLSGWNPPAGSRKNSSMSFL